jgi:hypothetical protein
MTVLLFQECNIHLVFQIPPKISIIHLAPTPPTQKKIKLFNSFRFQQNTLREFCIFISFHCIFHLSPKHSVPSQLNLTAK